MAASNAELDGKRRHAGPDLALGAALLGVVTLLFGRVVTFPFIAFDDVRLILQNPQVNGTATDWLDRLLTPSAGYITPVSVNVESLLFRLSGGQAWSFHGVALVLHAMAVLGVHRLALRLSASAGIAFGGALLFAVHPLCAQPVAWAICLKDLLMVDLALLATWSWLRNTDRPEPRFTALLGAGCLALLSMLAKPSATLIGLAWLGHAAAGRASGTPVPRRSVHCALWVTLAGLCVGVASRHAHETLLGEGVDWSAWSPLVVLGRNLAHVFLPIDLAIMYAQPHGGAQDPEVWLGLLALGACAAIAWFVRRKPKLALPLGLAACFYLPTSNVLPFARVMSDSYMYMPLAGMLIAASVGLSARAAAAGGRAEPIAIGCMIALAVPLALVCSKTLENYRGGDALWKPVVDAHPRLTLAQRLYADELLFRGRPEDAIEPYRQALILAYDPQRLLEFGTVLGLGGHLADAECVLIEAVAHGTAPARALHNYAALMAAHPEYDSRHPAIARGLLARANRVRQGEPQWPAALTPGLERQLQKLARVEPKDVAWPRQNCSVLLPDPP